jgi:hypothetical protein
MRRNVWSGRALQAVFIDLSALRCCILIIEQASEGHLGHLGSGKTSLAISFSSRRSRQGKPDVIALS